MVAVGCSVSIADLLEVFPENADDYIRQAYYLCLKNLMVQLGHIMQRFAPNEKITIFHDWTDHNAAILTAFEATIGVQQWVSRKFYTTIAPLHWQDCVQLQPTDLMAYEIYKATEAQRHTGRKMRRFLRELLGNNAQIAAKYFPKSVLEKIRDGLPLKTD